MSTNAATAIIAKLIDLLAMLDPDPIHDDMM
jgi:hypothetical protein